MILPPLQLLGIAAILRVHEGDLVGKFTKLIHFTASNHGEYLVVVHSLKWVSQLVDNLGFRLVNNLMWKLTAII
ncbi:hypothetical protein O6P43_027108 [Quillaja saponaria]|uniref:Uncharacterized protein n=1 Tax=Quillaja saponaria TaxID=32244 RepID=A0AAD7L452_QUISA|nr:hypothetical protein O6P43_027108 [Quillaja saponaria]